MKSTVLLPVVAVALTAVLTGCASSTDVREASTAALPGSGTSTAQVGSPIPSPQATDSSTAGTQPSSSSTPSVSSSQRFALIKGLTAIDPVYSTTPNQTTADAQTVCRLVRAGVSQDDLLTEVRKDFAIDFEQPSPETAQRILDVVKRTVCS